MLVDPSHESPKAFDLSWERFDDLLFENIELVREAERHAGERDCRTALWREVKIFPPKPQLPQELPPPFLITKTACVLHPLLTLPT